MGYVRSAMTPRSDSGSHAGKEQQDSEQYLRGRLRMTQSETAPRPSRDQLLMETALLWRKRGTCTRLKVGAVISREGRILVTGYNGAPAGMPHCQHNPQDDSGCEIAMHAESNAIAYAARLGIRLEGAEMHCTDSPCPSCARLIINAGLHRFTYRQAYRLDEGLRLLQQAGLTVRHQEW